MLWCKGKLQLPLTTVFCRHQPIGGSYLNSESYNLQGSTNSLQFSAGTNLQKAPTSVSYKWQLSSYNLIGKLQIPQFIKLNVCWFTSDISSVLLLLLIFLIFSTLFFYILHSLYFLSLPLHEIIKIDIIYRNSHMIVCISQGIWSEQSWLFGFCLLIPFSTQF